MEKINVCSKATIVDNQPRQIRHVFSNVEENEALIAVKVGEKSSETVNFGRRAVII